MFWHPLCKCLHLLNINQTKTTMEEKVLKALAQPMKAGEVAEATGIDKKEVEKIIKKLVAESKVASPKRCYYEAVKK